ncbi:MAG: DUF1566 domain-containing protein [Alcanivorax sp.]|nr:DUF1566 domain-containing protein [Alcanivorax sp.]
MTTHIPRATRMQVMYAHILALVLATMTLVACGGSSSGGSNEYTVTYEAAAGGALVGPAVQSVAPGADGEPVTAVPEPGYRFTGWSDGDTAAERQENAVQADITVTAQFAVFPAPASLSATTEGFSGRMALDWAPVAEASGYHIYIASEPITDIASYTALADHDRIAVDAPPTAITGLQNDREYHVVVTATAEPGESLASDPVSDTPFFSPVGGVSPSGVIHCTADGERQLACPVADFPGQDAEFGRESAAREDALVLSGGGQGGFDLSRLCNNGEEAGQGDCPPEPALGPGAQDWGCTRDNVTGLVWEAKVNSSAHLRHGAHTYSWYDDDATRNGGHAGTPDGGDCAGSECDTAAFVAAVNDSALCGLDDWRLPTMTELKGVLHLPPITGSNGPMGAPFFPNMPRSSLWSASTSTADTSDVLYQSFLSRTSYRGAKDGTRSVMLVSGSPRPAAHTGAASGPGITPVPAQTCANTQIPETTPSSDFVLIDNDTVARHLTTGLEWQRCPAGWSLEGGSCQQETSTLTWQAALQRADEADGWRLANFKELMSLVEYCAEAPVLNTEVFPMFDERVEFWSSSADMSGDSSAWVLAIRHGISNRVNTASDNWKQAWLVRDVAEPAP